jgi:nitrite reductase/ring-hydroxylating ferredoxin subunit
MSAQLEQRIESTRFTRGTRIPPQGVGGYDQTWFPVCFSTEVEKGKVIGRDLMNGRVIAFRDSAGVAHVMSAYCRHMGASLEVGTVVGDAVVCRFHKWEFDGTGRCVRIACGDPAPQAARLFKFPTVERWGLVFAFNGLEPLYEVPHFPVPDDQLEYRVSIGREQPTDTFVAYSNSMDFQHLEVVHGAKILTKPEDVNVEKYSVWYDHRSIFPGLGEMQQRIRIFGTNCITISGPMLGRDTYMMSVGRPLPGNRHVNYTVSATPKASGKPGEAQMIPHLLKTIEDFGNRLVEEDQPVMDTIRFSWDLLTKADHALSIYLKFVRDFPRTAVAQDMIT